MRKRSSLSGQSHGALLCRAIDKRHDLLRPLNRLSRGIRNSRQKQKVSKSHDSQAYFAVFSRNRLRLSKWKSIHFNDAVEKLNAKIDVASEAVPVDLLPLRVPPQ